MNLVNVSFNRTGFDLVLSSYQTGDSIRIENYFKSAQYQVADFQFADQTITSSNIGQYLNMATGMVQAMAAFNAGQAESAAATNMVNTEMVNVLLGASAA